MSGRTQLRLGMVRVALAIAATGLTIFTCYWLAEHLFFDRFFYQKSPAHGYWVASSELLPGLAFFGSRASDTRSLLTAMPATSSSILGRNDDRQIYTIAVIGDSYTWGTGVRESQRFVRQLEARLNQERPTKVLSLALEGDNLLDHWLKYQLLKEQQADLDLVIFALVHNDGLLKADSPYGEIQAVTAGCEGPSITELAAETTAAAAAVQYPEIIRQSMQPGTRNRCVLDGLLGRLPHHRALYLHLDSLLTSNPETLALAQLFQDRGFPVFGWQMLGPDLSPVQEQLFVSPRERHPSVLAHRLYAASLSKLLLEDPVWGFHPSRRTGADINSE